jgi:hypothetical protein
MLASLLLSPMTGLAFILREIAKATDAARDADRQAVMAELQELHRLIERGAIAESEFDMREAALLDRLETLSGDGADTRTGGTP